MSALVSYIEPGHRALYILLHRPTLCKQNPKHSLNSEGDNCCLTQGDLEKKFPPPLVLLSFLLSPPFN